jgi:hypothetical protein
MDAHGGKRRGAGRPSLPKMQRILYAAEWDRELQELTLARAVKTNVDKFSLDLEEARKELQKVPVQYRKRVQEIAEKPGMPTRGLPKVARDAIEHLRDIQKQLKGRQRLVSARTLQDGEREKIIAREARRLRQSPRQIRRWWDDYRALQQQWRSET